MLRRRHRQRQHIAHSLVEPRIGTLAVYIRLVLVLQIVLDVAELMMNGKQLVHRDARALFDAHIVVLVKVPGTRVADELSTVGRLLDDALVPEFSAKNELM